MNNMEREKFKIKIRRFPGARELKHGEYVNDKLGFAPECSKGKYDHRVDVWSFSQVAYRLMLKQRIRFGDLNTIARKTEWPVSKLDYSAELLHLIHTTLSCDFNSRPYPD